MIKEPTEKPAPSKPAPIAFRLSPEEQRRLEQLASLQEMSPGKFAREVLRKSLNDVESDQIRHRLSGLETEVTILRRELASSVRAMLVAMSSLGPGREEGEDAPVLTREDAIAWVDEHLGNYEA